MKKYVAMCVTVMGLSYTAMACDDYAHGGEPKACITYVGGACADTDTDEVARFTRQAKAKVDAEEAGVLGITVAKLLELRIEAEEEGITVKALHARHALAARLAAARKSADQMGIGCGDAFVRDPAALSAINHPAGDGRPTFSETKCEMLLGCSNVWGERGGDNLNSTDFYF